MWLIQRSSSLLGKWLYHSVILRPWVEGTFITIDNRRFFGSCHFIRSSVVATQNLLNHYSWINNQPPGSLLGVVLGDIEWYFKMVIFFLHWAPPTRSLSAFSRMVMNSNVPPSWALKIHVLELRENVVPPPYYCQLQVYCNGNSDINWHRGTTQCPPYQTVTGKIYHLKQHFLLPVTAWRFTKIIQVVLKKIRKLWSSFWYGPCIIEKEHLKQDKTIGIIHFKLLS